MRVVKEEKKSSDTQNYIHFWRLFSNLCCFFDIGLFDFCYEVNL